MIPDIKELNFPKKDGKQYATLTNAKPSLPDMGEKTITTQVKIDGEIAPDFSYDWAVEFKGEKYIQPLRIPQGEKGNESMCSEIDLTFQHWAIYQLKRWPFVTIQPIEAGTYIADEEVATVQLNLKDFTTLFGQVLSYYYGETIKIDLNPAWKYKQTATLITISHTKIWNVLIDSFHSKYGVRWAIEAAADNDNITEGGERYVIKVGYPTQEVDHIFEYGFDGGLMKIQRQVQSEEIRNMLKGRGGDTNIPFRYFKNTDPNNKDFRPDPDWVSELANIYFPNLMGATFRSYVQGWKAAHISSYPGYTAVGIDNAYSPWAYQKGLTDTKFQPVEFVADEIIINPSASDRHVEILPGYSPAVKSGSSLDKYGPLPDTLDNNDKIYPTIQGTGLDIAVAVEQITSDDIEASVESDAKPHKVPACEALSDIMEANTRKTVILESSPFTVEAGHTADLFDNTEVARTIPYRGNGHRWSSSDVVNVTMIGSPVVKVFNTSTGTERSASGIPAGDWYYRVEATIENNSTGPVQALLKTNPELKYAALQEDKWTGTFDIWVKNIWASTKLSAENDIEYAERVWKPILGDREGNEAAVMFTSGNLVHEDYEFKIPKGSWPVYDTSKTWEEKDSDGNVVATHTSHWRIRLAKSDAELEATGLYVPSTKKQGNAGDRFAFIGTELVHYPYVVDAEIRLDDNKKDHLGEVKEIKPTFVVTTDRIRFNQKDIYDPERLAFIIREAQGRILSQSGNGIVLEHSGYTSLFDLLRPGDMIRLADKRFIQPMGDRAYETLYLQSITYTYREPTSDDAALNPDVEIVLGNEYTTSANPVSTMQGEISALQQQIGSISNVEQIVRAVGDRLYLRKDGISDRSLSPTQFYSLLTNGNFRAGLVGGSGWGFFQDENGNWVLETDRVNVRQDMTVNSLVINQAEGRGGMQVDTAAYMQTTQIVETDSGYICYFDQKSGSVANLFHVGDVAYCNRWNPDTTALKFYKRRVTAITENSITLTKALDTSERPAGWPDSGVNGTGVPEEGDNIIHFGSYTDATRQYVKVRDVVGGGYERFLDGLDSVNATGTEYYFVGRQSGMYNGRPRFYIGDANGYVEWVNGELNIKGRLSLQSSIGDKNISTYVTEAAQSAADAAKEELQKQIDGVIEAFNGTGAPTLTNYPANEWTTDAERKRHNKDVYTDITPYVDDTTTPTSGQSWRWYYNSATDYGWVKIADSDAVRALQLAQISVRDTDVLYISHTSQTSAPALPTVNTNGEITDTKGWQTTAPAWSATKYIWQTTYVRKGDGTATFSDPTCISGRNGQDGTNVTISSTEVRYSTAFNSATQPADATFTLTAIPTLSAGQYLWSRTTVTYNNGDSTTTYGVSRIGDNGASYNPNLFKNKYFKGSGNSTAVDGGIEITTANQDTYFFVELDDGVTLSNYNGQKVTFSCVCEGLPEGEGYGFGLGSSAKNHVHVNKNGLNVSVLTLNEIIDRSDNRLLFDDAITRPSTAGATVKITQCCLTLGENSNQQWVPAASEMVAPTITSRSVTYAKTTTATQPADSAFTYSSIGAAGVTAGDYLWTKTEVNYSDGNGTKSYSVSRIGADGTDGLPGTPGTDGKTPYVHFAYCKGIVGSLPHPSAVSMFNTVAFEGAKYIGVCSDYTQADPTDKVETTYEWSEYKGADGVPAKTVIVNSDAQAFVYTDDFATLVGPQSIALSATLQGTSGYQWSYKLPSQSSFTNISGATSATYTLAHNAAIWGSGNTNKAITLRCTSGGVHDEVTIVKVSSGSNGTDGTNGANYSDNLLLGTQNWDGWNKVLYTEDGEYNGLAVRHGIIDSTYSGSYKDLRIDGKVDFENDTVYTLSVWAKGTGRFQTFCYPNVNAQTIIIDGAASGSTSTDTAAVHQLTSEWKRYYVVFRTKATGDLTGKNVIAARIEKAYPSEIWVVGAKLEKGQNENTQWTPAASEMTGKDAYTVILTNESHIFEGDTEKAIASSTESGVIAYKGATQMPATIGTITGAPTGMTVSVQNNTSNSAKFTVMVTTSLTAKQGVLNVPITVDGKSFTKKFSWSLSLKGKDGRGIVSTVELYAVNNSSTVAPADNAFSTTVPATSESNRYLWNYEKVTYTDGTFDPTDKRVIGVHGVDGKGIVSIENYYLASSQDSGVTTTTSGWTTDPTAASATTTDEKPYLWNYEKVTYTKGNPTSTTPHIIGKRGVGVRSITEQYYLSTSRVTLQGGSWSDTKQTWEAGKFYWTRSKITYTDGKVEYTTGICVTGEAGTSVMAEYSANGTSWHPVFTSGDVWMRTSSDGGATWTPGMRIVGKDGTSVSMTGSSVKYQGSDSGTVIPTGEWLNQIPALSAGQYLWSKTTIMYSNGISTDAYGVSRVGVDGAGIASVEVRYAVGNYPTQPADSAFTRTSIGTLNKGDYLWTRTTTTYTDGATPTKSYSVSRIGADGTDGLPGTPGTDGKTPYVHFAYCKGIVGSLPHPSAVSMFNTVAFEGAKYIGVCSDYTQADPQTATPYEWSEYKGADAEYHVFQWAIGDFTQPTGTWSDTPLNAASGQAVWMRHGIVTPPSTNVAWDSTPIRLTGADGNDGSDTYLLDFDNESVAILCDSTGAPVSGQLPLTINAHLYKGGTEVTPVNLSYEYNPNVSVTTGNGTVEISGIYADKVELQVTTAIGTLTLYSIINIYKVKPGAKGADAVVYSLEPSVNVVTKSLTTGLSANQITCTKYRTTGATARTTTTANTLKATIYTNGAAGSEQTIASTSQTSGSVTINDSTTGVLFVLYRGTTTTVLDREYVPVISDASDLQVGGTNILLKTNQGTENWMTNTSTAHKIGLSIATNSQGVVFTNQAAEAVPSGSGWQMIGYRLPKDVIKSGKYYTLSFTAKAVSPQTITGRFQISSTTGGDLITNRGSFSFTSTETRHKILFKTTGTQGASQSLWCYLFCNAKWTSIEIRDLKLEEGTMATEWSPAPQDFNYITSALRESATLDGGLMLASLIRLGYTVEDGEYRIMSGINGIATPGNRDIAIWTGGEMRDATDPENTSYNDNAAYAMRHDGNGYACQGNVRFIGGRILIGQNRDASGNIKSDEDFALNCVALDGEGLTLYKGGNECLIVADRSVGNDFISSEEVNNWSVGGDYSAGSLAMREYHIQQSSLESVDGSGGSLLVDSYDWYATNKLTKTYNVLPGAPYTGGVIPAGLFLKVGELKTWVNQTEFIDKNVHLTMTAELCYNNSAGKKIVVATQRAALLKKNIDGTRWEAVAKFGTHTVQVAAAYYLVITVASPANTLGMLTGETCSAVTYIKGNGDVRKANNNVTIIGTDGIVSLWSDQQGISGGILANQSGVKIKGYLTVNGKEVVTKT